MKSIIIGIAGGTGSGKTTLTERLRDHFGADEVSVINHDSYYKRHDELPYEERCKLNYDHPDSFDTELLVQHLQALRRGESVKVPVYDYTIHNRSDKTITVHPAPVIIVEGILIFASQELCDMMDMKVFVDTDADVRILRRIVRDVKERGRISRKSYVGKAWSGTGRNRRCAGYQCYRLPPLSYSFHGSTRLFRSLPIGRNCFCPAL